MRPAEKIKSLFNNSKIAVNGEVNSRLLNDAMAAFKRSKSTMPAKFRPSAWRIIMKSRVTRIAVAAVIMIVAMVLIRDMGGSIDGATAAFAKMTKAVREAQWMHVVHYEESVIDGRIDSNSTREQWLSYPLKVYASISPKGEITYVDQNQHKWFEYSPDSNSVTVRYWQPSSMSVNRKLLTELEPENFFDWWLERANDPNAQISNYTDTYDGQPVEVLEVRIENADDSSILRFITDPETRLPAMIESSGIPKNNGKRWSHFGHVQVEYPDEGPESIYDLGVSCDIPAELDDDMPDGDAVRVWEEYRALEKDFYDVTDRYIVITTECGRVEKEGAWINGRHNVYVEYKDNPRRSTYFYFVGEDWNEPDVPPPSDELPADFDGLLAWSKKVKKFPYYNYKQTWLRSKKELPWGLSRLERYAWPMDSVEGGRIIEDDYSVENNLICVCVERTQRFSPTNSRWLYYLDPTRDYICQREISEWGIKDGKPQCVDIRDIVEYGRTGAGKWYPRKLAWRGYKDDELTSEGIIDVYLRTDVDFSDDVFDESVDKPEYPPDVICPSG